MPDKQYLWDVYTSQLQSILKDGFQAYTGRFDPEQVHKATTEGKKVVCCIDERVPGSLHAAGGLLLLEKAAAAEVVKTHGITGITSHEDCGAAGIAYRKEHALAVDVAIEPQVLNEYAQAAAKKLAAELGVEYAGHIDHVLMWGPQGLHIARAIYYHSTPYFNVTAIERVIPGFVVSRSILSKEQALADVELSIAIAFGASGFGELFSKQSPLLIIPLGARDGELSTAQLEKELEGLEEKYEGRVKLESWQI